MLPLIWTAEIDLLRCGQMAVNYLSVCLHRSANMSAVNYSNELKYTMTLFFFFPLSFRATLQTKQLAQAPHAFQTPPSLRACAREQASLVHWGLLVIRQQRVVGLIPGLGSFSAEFE